MAQALRKGLSFWGMMSRLGLIVLGLTFAADQISKTVLLHAVGLTEREPIPITSFFDLVLLWNKGVSYSLFEQGSQWPLIIMSIAVSAVLWSWLSRTPRRLTAIALGLIIGGALGNALDRVIYGGVADFAHFHWGDFSWYVFNIADVAIVVGVALLLYESLRESGDRSRLGNA
jgi:signal peptidase II